MFRKLCFETPLNFSREVLRVTGLRLAGASTVARPER